MRPFKFNTSEQPARMSKGFVFTGSFPPALLLKYLYSEWSKTTHEHIKLLSQERVVLSVTKSRKPIKLSLLCSYYEVLTKTVYVVDDILSSHNTESFKYDLSLVYWVYIMKS